ncbi:hypothetical protein OAE79_00410 [Rhodopirellula sp.]|nr:hypothetical protein [Rhodopirellula sp.]
MHDCFASYVSNGWGVLAHLIQSQSITSAYLSTLVASREEVLAGNLYRFGTVRCHLFLSSGLSAASSPPQQACWPSW